MNPLKQWAKDHGWSYQAIANETRQSKASVTQKMNGKVWWQEPDLAWFRAHGLTSDFVIESTRKESEVLS
ncbi:MULTISPECIES: hypothetical protein [Bifidobacterium]|uniref:XRE family transcriptional regulator n=2 Tax=Bifidobacterium TaxID=1678 RepID=A0A261FNH8_9BIFI|nr:MULTISPECIES: hypothetical protein [Bifidobacterium]OZG60740.1 hypothetical protein BLEM_1709 [Bifidobacterium lemurum]OZG69638.1 hypothetical protein BEUL_0055 [Bifidobacterium eulemuris]QOL32248.1 XRE family transcriptional regulator [Bifidobacterium eulemuris]QOL35208.1 XRE family transcriptional regulator [Bifidobacterium lemurum]